LAQGEINETAIRPGATCLAGARAVDVLRHQPRRFHGNEMRVRHHNVPAVPEARGKIGRGQRCIGPWGGMKRGSSESIMTDYPVVRLGLCLGQTVRIAADPVNSEQLVIMERPTDSQ
jgi:hypothetical protein